MRLASFLFAVIVAAAVVISAQQPAPKQSAPTAKASLDTMQANVAKIANPAEKERWQTNAAMWQTKIGHTGKLDPADLAKMQSSFDTMKTNVAKITDPAEKERWQANTAMWQVVVDQGGATLTPSELSTLNASLATMKANIAKITDASEKARWQAIAICGSRSSRPSNDVSTLRDSCWNRCAGSDAVRTDSRDSADVRTSLTITPGATLRQARARSDRSAGSASSRCSKWFRGFAGADVSVSLGARRMWSPIQRVREPSVQPRLAGDLVALGRDGLAVHMYELPTQARDLLRETAFGVGDELSIASIPELIAVGDRARQAAAVGLNGVFGHHLGVERRELSMPIHYLLPIVGSCAQRVLVSPKDISHVGE